MNVYIYDIECFNGMFLFCAMHSETGERFSFELSMRKNELDSMIRFLEDRKDEYFVGYNNIRYDSQVVQYIVKENWRWHNLDSSQILKKIKKFSNDVISDQDFDSFPPYRERSLCFKQIDLMKIHHFDNKNRRAALKWIAFMIDAEDIEELPFPHFKEDFTEEELDKVVEYCWKDVSNTLKFYKMTLGESDNEFYKGKNKIQDRLDIIEEMNFPPETMNFSDVKIGDEINKRGYCNIKGIDEKQLYEIRKQRGPTPKITFGDCIPSYVVFETPELQKFYNTIKNQRVDLSGEDLDGDQEFKISFRGTDYVIARGGIHSCEKHRVIIPKSNELLRDADVGSQHPTAIVKRKLAPLHLGPEWLVNYNGQIVRRMDYKERGKTNKRYKGLSDMFKLALNGGGFGKTIDRSNWQYGPEVGFGCTIGNQFEILMLIERMEIAGIHVVSANTDGILCLFDRDLEDKYKEICKWWEVQVGNTEQGKLEFSDFKMIAQESVNHYIAIKVDEKGNEELKVKGRLSVDCEVYRNNTKDIGRIERKAIVNYFHKGIPVEETIMGSRNIFDFCIGVKSSWDYHYETIDEAGNRTEHKKIIRYFISKSGVRLIKVKNEDSEKTGAKLTRVAGENLVTIFNTFAAKPWEDYKIDYDYYIQNAQAVVNTIEGNKNIDKNQLTLF